MGGVVRGRARDGAGSGRVVGRAEGGRVTAEESMDPGEGTPPESEQSLGLWSRRIGESFGGRPSSVAGVPCLLTKSVTETSPSIDVSFCYRQCIGV